MRLLRLVVCLFALCALQACGGGGGGSTQGPGSSTEGGVGSGGGAGTGGGSSPGGGTSTGGESSPGGGTSTGGESSSGGGTSTGGESSSGGGTSTGGGNSPGGGSTGGGTTSSGDGLTITLDRNSLAFTAFERETLSAQVINVTASGQYDGELYVGATVDGQGIDPTIRIDINGTTARIFVSAASGLPPGLYVGRIFFHVCSDARCANHVGGTPLEVAYNVTIKRGVHLSPTALTLETESGNSVSSDISVQLPDGHDSYTVVVPPTQLDWVSISERTSSSFKLTTRSLPVGNYATTIRIESGRAIANLPVSYKVNTPPGGVHGILANPQSLTLMTTEGAEVSQTLSVTPPTWQPGLVTSIEYQSTQRGWLTVTPVTGGYSLRASAAELSQGSYSAHVFISTVPAHESILVPVALTVGPGFVKPATALIEIDSDTLPTQLSGRSRIDIAGGPAVDWTATTSTPWLTLTRANGRTGTDVEFTIDPTVVNSWSNFTDHTAQIRIVGSAPNLTPMDCDIEVRLRLAEVTGVGPYLLIQGQSSRMIVRGRGFSKLATPLTRLRLGDAAAVSATLVNDTELAIDAGALPLGVHAVAVTNGLNRTLQSRNVRVIAAESYAYKAFPLSLNQIEGPFLYDAERQNAYVKSVVPLNLLRFPVRSASTNAETLSSADGFRLGMSPDGSSYVTGDQYSVAFLDPDTLAAVPGTVFSTLSTPLYGKYPVGVLGLIVSNDARLWFDDYSWLQLETKAAGTITLSPGVPNSVRIAPKAISRNGERIVGIDTSVNPAFDTYALVTVDAADSVLRRRADPVSVFSQVMVSDDGERILASYRKVLDGQLNDVGDIVLPASANDYDPLTAAISPDGTKVYVITYERSDYYNPSPSHLPRVYVFDSTNVVNAPQTLPVLGYFELDRYPNCMLMGCYSQTFASITPDGGALLIVGNRAFLVVPTNTPLITSAGPDGAQKSSPAPALRTVPWKLERNASGPRR
jgi:hypothetical protein